MKKVLPLAAVATLIALSSYVQGVWTERWSVSHELEEGVKRLAHVSPVLGNWSSRPLELDPRQKEQGGVEGYLLRRYENPHNRQGVVVLITCGRPGPMSVHTPEVCYGGVGYSASNPVHEIISSGKAKSEAVFWTAQFTKNQGKSRLRLYWAWRGQNGWEAPRNPRFHFAGLRYLYKLYVIQDVTFPDERIEKGVCQEFMHQLLPALDRCLVADK